jgi:hypothetical protein
MKLSSKLLNFLSTMKHGVLSMTKSCQKIVSELKEKCIVVRMFGYVLSNILSSTKIFTKIAIFKL